MMLFGAVLLVKQVLFYANRRRGADVAFAGGGSSVLAVAGADERSGCVMLLDTLAPPASAAIARINCSHVCVPHRDAAWHCIQLCLSGLENRPIKAEDCAPRWLTYAGLSLSSGTSSGPGGLAQGQENPELAIQRGLALQPIDYYDAGFGSDQYATAFQSFAM